MQSQRQIQSLIFTRADGLEREEPRPTWSKDDGVPDHDVVRLGSSRDACGRVGLEPSEIPYQTSSCGRRLRRGGPDHKGGHACWRQCGLTVIEVGGRGFGAYHDEMGAWGRIDKLARRVLELRVP